VFEQKFKVFVEGRMSTPREIQAGVHQGSVLSPTMYSMHISDNPKHQVFIWPSLPMTVVCMPQIAKRVMFSESHIAVSIQLRSDACAGTLKSMKRRLEPSTSLIDLDNLRLISH
jgi:hypothetical protein